MTFERVDIDSWCTLYHADSTEIMDVLREHEPDAVVMDPPYGIALHNAGYKRTSQTVTTNKGTYKYGEDGPAQDRRGDTRIVGDDGSVDIRPWLDFAPQCLTWGADYLRHQLPRGGRMLAWDKLAGMEPWDSFADVEFAWHSRSGKATLISHLWKGIVQSKVGGETPHCRREHPTMKPTRVMQWCIRECRLEPGATILDPYMGSGTTAIAAFGLDMRFVGVEIERRWFDAAVRRITDRCPAGLFT